MARPIEIDESLFETLAQELKDGATNGAVAALLGVTDRTYRRWLAVGEQDASEGKDSPYTRLWTAHTQARGAALGSAAKRVFKERPLEWLRMGPGRDEWADHRVIEASIQTDVQETVQQQVFVDVRLPSDFPEGSEWRENFDKALAWMHTNDLLLIDESDDEEEEPNNE